MKMRPRFTLPKPAMCVAMVALASSLAGNALAAGALIKSSAQVK
jgi:hypothetical protein